MHNEQTHLKETQMMIMLSVLSLKEIRKSLKVILPKSNVSNPKPMLNNTMCVLSLRLSLTQRIGI